jgi:DNA repair protein RadC
LKKFKGIGEAKAIAIMSALELGRRRKETAPMKKVFIKTSRDIYDEISSDLMDQSHEEFWILLMKRNSELIKKQQISKGGVSGTIVDPKIIFKYALDEQATGIFLIHNHPSNNAKPSHTDILLTRKLKEAGKLLDISILDHLIFTNHDYFSFADESLL